MVMNFFVENIYSVIVIPLWVSLLILLGKLFGVISSKKVINVVTLLSTVFSLIMAIGAFVYTATNKGFVTESTIPFITISNFNFLIGTYIDGVTTWFLLLAVIVSLLVQIYSISYMKDDISYARFFAYLNLFNFSMFGLILSPNLFQMYIFWELVGLVSYLLIGFWYKKEDVSIAAKRTFIINRIGDFAFLSGIILSAYIILTNLGNISSVSIPFSEMMSISAQIYGCTSDGIFILTCVLLLFGSIAKSAQFPLHSWLIDAMKGPTPVSALIHSATMVAAGVFLLIRLYPLYSLSNIILNIISVIGLVTAIMCSYSAITQTDIKKILAYSTNAQLGLMFLAVGSCSVTVGLFHLTSHAFAKAMLFLVAGTVIHYLNFNQDIRFAGGLRKYLPVCAFTFLIGIFSLTGILFAGFTSKELIFYSLIENNHYLYAVIFVIVAFMTAYYLFRLYFYLFEGEENFDIKSAKKSSILMTYTPTIFGFFIILLWFIFPKSSHVSLAIINYFVIAIAALSSYWFFRHRDLNIKIPILYKVSYNAFYADEVNKFVHNLYVLIMKMLLAIEKYICDGISYLTTFLVRLFALVFSKMQTGNIQSYLVYSLFFITASFAGIILIYALIIFFSEVQ